MIYDLLTKDTLTPIQAANRLAGAERFSLSIAAEAVFGSRKRTPAGLGGGPASRLTRLRSQFSSGGRGLNRQRQQIACSHQVVSRRGEGQHQPTRATPRWRVFLKPATIFSQPKTSSIRLRLRRLTA